MKRLSVSRLGAVLTLAAAVVALAVVAVPRHHSPATRHDAATMVALAGYDADAAAGPTTHATTYVVHNQHTETMGQVTVDLPKIKGGVYQLSYNMILNDNDTMGQASCQVVYEPDGSFSMVAYGFAMNSQITINDTSVVSFSSADTLRIKCTSNPGTDLIGFNTDGSNRTTVTLIKLGSRTVHNLPKSDNNR